MQFTNGVGLPMGAGAGVFVWAGAENNLKPHHISLDRAYHTTPLDGDNYCSLHRDLDSRSTATTRLDRLDSIPSASKALMTRLAAQ